MGILIVIIQFLASLSLLVLIHEFGHFLFARLFGMKVDKFYIFFNPGFTLYKHVSKKTGTEYGIGWLPLGGYTKIAGMIDESLDTEQMDKPAQPWEFRSHPAWHRLLVMVAGVLFNFIFALMIFVGVLYAYGHTYMPLQSVKAGMEFSEAAQKAGFHDGDILLRADTSKLLTLDQDNFRKIINAETVTVLRNGKEVVVYIPADMVEQMLKEQKGFAGYRYPFIVDSVMAGTPAALAQLRKGDEFCGVNGRRMFASDIRTTIHNNAGKVVTLEVKRGARSINVRITPSADGMVGVSIRSIAQIYPVQTRTYSLLESIPAGISNGWHTLTGYVGDMKYVFTSEGASSVGGFGSIASLYPDEFNGQAFWNITAFISLALAFMNLLPIPALDGGHVMFLLYEIIFRRKPSRNVLIKSQVIGMVLLLLLFVYANMNDLFRFLQH
jgi:regulator of sigma E protease